MPLIFLSYIHGQKQKQNIWTIGINKMFLNVVTFSEQISPYLVQK
jgi:hypothetical protein